MNSDEFRGSMADVCLKLQTLRALADDTGADVLAYILEQAEEEAKKLAEKQTRQPPNRTR